MNLEQILKKINNIFIDIIDDENIKLDYSTTSQDIDGWESLTHFQLIMEIEKHFKIRFSIIEIQSFMNVGDLCNAVFKKINDN
ncbi:MAG: acyl carrier protein [Candidatus Sericytochromatia bacterium]|nr:acyl carrier protein [Candidatus Sericytochromatia bacterium]